MGQTIIRKSEFSEKGIGEPALGARCIPIRRPGDQVR